MNASINEYVLLLILKLLVFLTPNDCKSTPDIQLIDCGVTKEEGHRIVNKHNEYRKLIAMGKVPNQPRGVDLLKMKWDSRLADEAERIAKLGVFAHKKVHDKRWPFVGQNLHMHTSGRNSSNRNWERCLSSWFDEHKTYQYGPAEVGDKAGHYTQMVWSNSVYVGCGFCFYKDVTKKGMPFHKLYVCNYGPAGNFVGQVPYKKGFRGCEELC